MHRDAKQNRLSNTAFVNSEPSTPDLNIKDFRVKISENAAQVTLTQPPERQEITRQKSTSSGEFKVHVSLSCNIKLKLPILWYMYSKAMPN